MTDPRNHEDARSHGIGFSDPRTVDWSLAKADTNLDKSDRQALVEEISRRFRQSPAQRDPVAGLESELERTQEGLSWVLQQLETQESPEVSSQVELAARTVCKGHRIPEEETGRVAAQRFRILSEPGGTPKRH